ncbi:Hypothetical predicted protein [Olea europaea subsp. europaea]|uniref:Uncharacterized protein n=1 Tax=Olea europaea subsp. europaea TaxID=158383 RepID=A0A8S0UMQ7_OLEEU|nr:Hypothetical predicted protein [Olea europaea subsp. europaea]
MGKGMGDEILIKEYKYLVQKAKEQQLPEDIPLEEIPVDDPNVGINITMSVLVTKPRRQIRGLGDGRLRDIHTSSSNVHNLEKVLETERATRMAADATLVKMEQRMQHKMKVVEKQFNFTLQSWHHSIHQLCGKVHGFVVPPFTPLSIENNADEEDDAIDDEKNNFDDDQSHI